MSNTAVATTRRQPSLGLVSKLLPVWILLAMAVGLLLGKYVPQVGKALEPGIPWACLS